MHTVLNSLSSRGKTTLCDTLMNRFICSMYLNRFRCRAKIVGRRFTRMRFWDRKEYFKRMYGITKGAVSQLTCASCFVEQVSH